MRVPDVVAGQALAVVDIEGSGTVDAEIVEIAVLPINAQTRDTYPGMVRSWLVRPHREINPIATRKAHGLSAADVADAPRWEQIADEIAELLAERVLVAHHAATEYRMLATHLPAGTWAPVGVLDTMRLGGHLWPQRTSYRLGDLAAFAGIDTEAIPGRAHRAGFDTWLTWRLFGAQLAAGGLSWEELVRVATPRSLREHQRSEAGLW